jgi:hypothetical protein
MANKNKHARISLTNVSFLSSLNLVGKKILKIQLQAI